MTSRNFPISSVLLASGLLLGSVGSHAQSQTKAGVEGYDALYGKPEGADTLPPKWVPKAPPNPHPDAQWFGQSALGLFMHWGIVSGTPHGEAWDMRVRADKSDKLGSDEELLQNKISPALMFERAKTFNPRNYQPDHWMQAASAAGFRYAVLTTRHHDAYFLGDSQFGDWHAGHYIGRDLIAPYTEACRKNGIKVGFYFSGPDWYHGKEYQSYTVPENKPPFFNWKHERVESIPPMPAELRQSVKEIAHGQIRELLTKYGKIDLLWPDAGLAGFDHQEAYRLQPGMIIGRSSEYATPEGWGMMKMEFIKEANRRGYPWEFCTIGHDGSWHWSEKAEAKGTTAQRIIGQLAQVRARGGVLLINIGPRPDGEMPAWFYPLCEQMAQWMKTGAEAIHDIHLKGPFPYPDQCKSPVTVGPKGWYVFPNPKKKETLVTGVGKPKSVTLLRNGAEIPFEHANQTLSIRLPQAEPGALPEVVKIVWATDNPQKIPAAESAQPLVPNHEPANDGEVQMQNKFLDKIKPEEYAKWVEYVKSRPAEEQVWLRTLEANLGNFYGPPCLKDFAYNRVTPQTAGWAYVKDNPALPRVLIIGDSISRSYTAPARIALEGKANVHRAPANCGRTDNFFTYGEVWLNQNGSNKWDLITVNFGIHDKDKSATKYEANLKAIFKRLRETGAKILFVTTTPWSKIEDPAGTDRSLPVNESAVRLAKEEGIPVIDMHGVMIDDLATLQNPKDHTHFNDEGIKKMGQALVKGIEPYLKPKK